MANQHRAISEGIQVASTHNPESCLWAIQLLLVGPSKVFSHLQQRTDSRETLPYTGLQLTNTHLLLKPCSPTMNQGLLKLRSPLVCILEHGSHSQVFLSLSDFKRLCFLSLLPHQALLSADHLSHAAAAAKSLQLCPTLCDPIDGSPPGSPVPGILQARTLEWVAISFSNA